MQVQVLGQGFESESINSVGNHLIRLLSNKNFHPFTAISAFVSQSGVYGLSSYIDQAKAHLDVITIITGVDQQGTSKEALEALINLDVNAFVFYQPSHTIFHPKIYLFEGHKESVLIVGSSNLTAQGLFSNIETSIMFTVDNQEGSSTITELKKYYQGLFDLTDPNLQPLDNKLIEDLVNEKIVPSEAERSKIHDKVQKSNLERTKNLIYRIFPKRKIARIPSEFRRKSKLFITKKPSEAKTSPNFDKGLFIWESNALTQRDLNIPKGENTNPTGSMLFKKGKNKGIDQRHFFRDDVFDALN